MDSRRDLAGMSFLVMEDSMHMIAILRSILNGFGVRKVYEASDGADGLEVIGEKIPDFILCDWEMSPTGGATFVHALRAEKDPRLNTIPVLVISGHSHKRNVLEAMQLGVHGFLAKPVSPTGLYQHVASILYRQSIDGRSKGMTPPSRSLSRQEKNEIREEIINDSIETAEQGEKGRGYPFMLKGMNERLFN
ncbi:MAG: response regulator [Rhodobacteraceae bacterium]|nr:response regulator [Paracoccaceae bacterium]